jgi:beta-lactamase regulating signal transducer with metallopeptidase domain
MTSFIISLAVRLTILLIAGGIAVFVARRSTSAVRHVVIAVTLLCIIALPAMMFMVPQWRVAVLPTPEIAPAPVITIAPVAPLASEARMSIHPVLITSDRVVAAPTTVGTTMRPSRTMTIPEAALSIWLFGVAIGLLWLAAGRYGLARVRRRATPLDTREWRAMLDAERAHAGVTQDVTLLASDAVSTPVTWGILEPVIVLPEAALVWSDERRRVVLMHELAHIARRDSATQLVATLACVAYWIHPLVILAARRLRAECERACDERVLELGTPATDYAAHLLDVARFARSFGAASIVSVAMARPSQLEGRLLAVLRATPGRGRASGRSRVLGTMFAACALVAVSAFSPVAKDAPFRSTKLMTKASILNGEYSNDRASIEAPTPPTAITLKVRAKMPVTRFDSTFEKSVPVHSGGTLTLDLDTGGDIDITAGDQSTVSVTGSIGGRDWQQTTVSLDSKGDDSKLVTRYVGDGRSQSFGNSFSIKVPKSYNVRIHSAGGRVSISGVDGSFKGTTGGGEIRIDGANGSADLSTGGGDVHVSKSHLDGNIATGGGTVKFSDVTGGLTGYSGSEMRGSRGMGYGYGMGSGDFDSQDSTPREFAWKDSDGTQFKWRDSSAKHFKFRKIEVQRFKWRTPDSTGADYREMDSMPMEIIIDTMVMKQTREAMRHARDAIEQNRDAMARAEVMMERNRGAMDRMSRTIVIDKDGGDIRLSDVPDGAHVATGGGTIIIGRSSGRVMAETGGGNITIDAAEGAAKVTTGAGNVTITTVGKDAHSVDVRSGTGGVLLQLPKEANATLDLETAYTNEKKPSKIISDWPVTVTVSPDWDSSHGTPRKYVRVQQDIGKGGSVIRVRTVNGNIELKREH